LSLSAWVWIWKEREEGGRLRIRIAARVLLQWPRPFPFQLPQCRFFFFFSSSSHIHVKSNNVLCFVQVGTYFVGQYYQVLQSQPEFVHQFYSDASTMLRVDGNTRETAAAMLVIYCCLFCCSVNTVVFGFSFVSFCCSVEWKELVVKLWGEEWFCSWVISILLEGVAWMHKIVSCRNFSCETPWE